MTEKRRAEVAGAGVAGLAIGLVLARAGWRVQVHERSPSVREIGSGIFLKGNALSPLENMGLRRLVEDRGVRLTKAEVWDERGRLLQRRSLDGPAVVQNLPRQELLAILLDAALEAGVVIRTNSLVTSARADGTLILASGEELAADLVIGADGHRSVVRDSLGLTAEFSVRRTGAIRLLIPRIYPEEAVAGTTEYWSGNRRIGIAMCTRTETYVYMSSRNSDAASARLPIDIETWRAAFPPIAGFFSRLEGADASRHPYSHVRCHSWSRGRVALLGDAAHALPPTLGQGAGMAIMNASALARALEGDTEIFAALKSWELKSRPLTDATQRWALRYDTLTEAWPPALSDIRSGIIWTVGHWGWLNRRMRSIDRVREAPRPPT